MIIMVICVSVRLVRVKWVWYLGGAKIELCRSCVQLLSCSAFNFVAVVAQFGLPISEQVAKIHHRLAVCSCDLHLFFFVIAALDSSANEIYGI